MVPKKEKSKIIPRKAGKKPGPVKKPDTSDNPVLEVSKDDAGICHQFRDNGICSRMGRCPYRHVAGEGECTNAAYLKTGCCSDHRKCPHVHKFDSQKYGPKHLAIKKMLQGVKEGLYLLGDDNTHVFYLQELLDHAESG